MKIEDGIDKKILFVQNFIYALLRWCEIERSQTERCSAYFRNCLKKFCMVLFIVSRNFANSEKSCLFKLVISQITRKT